MVSTDILDDMGYVPEDDVDFCPSLCAIYYPPLEWDGEEMAYFYCQRLQDAYEAIVERDPRSHAPRTDSDDFEDIPF